MDSVKVGGTDSSLGSGGGLVSVGDSPSGISTEAPISIVRYATVGYPRTLVLANDTSNSPSSSYTWVALVAATFVPSPKSSSGDQMSSGGIETSTGSPTVPDSGTSIRSEGGATASK